MFIALLLKYKQCFHENIINNDANYKNYNTTMRQSYSTYFNSIGKKNTHLAKVWFGHNKGCQAHFMFH